jgi:hypothetical protein
MSHGFGGVQLQIEAHAGYFAEAGFAVLLYDHRGFGLSDGAPRQEVNPYIQLSDWRDAISLAGGLAMVLAADDPRVSCVVAQIPNVSGHRNGAKIFTAEQLVRSDGAPLRIERDDWPGSNPKPCRSFRLSKAK